MGNRRKELKAQYKQRKVTGGIYRITNQRNGRFYLSQTTDMQGTHNWFLSCCASALCTHPCLVREWDSYGKEAFVFEALETWEKDAEQSNGEFASDLQELFEIWDSKLPQDNRY
ncbi:MAG: GIY-YIG nuclease family protein [Clostridiales bacterium]|nr:GIY-YIG nuclease family protein [Clostridiales bacterium]